MTLRPLLHVVGPAWVALLASFAAGCGSAPDAPDLGQVRQAVTGCQVPLRGVNLSSAEFGSGANEFGCPQCPGTYGQDYIYPIPDDNPGYDPSYFATKGMNTVRLPFRWERLQKNLGDPLDPNEVTKLYQTLDYLTGIGMAAIILDPHNYARYMTSTIGQGVTAAQFADFWQKLAFELRDYPTVVYGLMNEPHDMPTETWRDAAQAGVNAIRAAGSKQLILVPGNAYTGAWTWDQAVNGATPNSDVMGGITDPENNVAFEVHQYLDRNGSGKRSDSPCVSATIGSERLSSFTSWARSKHRRAFLGELGTGTSSTCLSAVGDMLKHVEQNADVYLGWTWWAAGPWWTGYFLGLDPVGGADRPQMTALDPHIQWEGSATNCPPPIVPPVTVPEAGTVDGGVVRRDGGAAGSAGGAKSDAAGASGGAGGGGAEDPPPDESD